MVKELPIMVAKQKIIEEIKADKIVIIIGDTGSGKSTKVSQFLIKLLNFANSKIGCTQPRRIAAMSVAKYVAYDTNTKLGDFVGYTVRFENNCKKNTKIKYLTEGILINESCSSMLMEYYNFIIIDEVHERTLALDLILGLVLEIRNYRSSLRLIIMSATLEIEKFIKYFINTTSILVPGRCFPVEIFYSFKPEKSYFRISIIMILNLAFSGKCGDILLFLTGEDEIEEFCNLFEDLFGKLKDYLKLVPIYANMCLRYQDLLFDKSHLCDDGAQIFKKVIVSTNIAETSITLDNIGYVIDSGFSKKKVYNPRLLLESLLISPISKASSHQRAGRAGRTENGKCFRLYTEQTFFLHLTIQNFPEIICSNLHFMILILKKLGIEDIIFFDFLDPPSPESLMRSLEILKSIDSIDKFGNLTNTGFLMSVIPLDPFQSKSVLESCSLSSSCEVITIICMLSINFNIITYGEEEFTNNKLKNFFNNTSDHITLLNIYHTWRIKRKKKEWAIKYYLNFRNLESCDQIRKQIIKICRKAGIALKINYFFNHRFLSNILITLLKGYIFQSAKYVLGSQYITLFEKHASYVHPSSSLSKNFEYLIFDNLLLTNELYMCIVSGLKKIWIVEVFKKLRLSEKIE